MAVPAAADEADQRDPENAMVRSIHPAEIPVILREEEWDTWLRTRAWLDRI
jgi:putative SOS response-associated peptidase YedK